MNRISGKQQRGKALFFPRPLRALGIRKATLSAASSGASWVRPGHMPGVLETRGQRLGPFEIPEAPGLSVSSETD